MLTTFIALLAATVLLGACPEEEPTPAPDIAADATSSDAQADANAPDAVVGPPDLSLPLADGEVAAGIVQSRDALLTGLKAEGQLGDLKIYNAHVAFIVEGARMAGGWRELGGHVVDAAVTGEDDLYGELFTVWNLDIFHPESVEVVSDGKDGLAHVRVTGTNGPFDLATGFLDSLLSAPPTDLGITIDYTLGPADRALNITYTLTNRDTEPVTVESLLMTAHGDGARLYSTSGNGWDNEAGGGAPVRYLGAVGPRQAYGYTAVGDPLQLLFSPVSIAVLQRNSFSINGGSFLIQRSAVMATMGGANALDRWWWESFAPDTATGTVSGSLNVPAGVDGNDAYVVAWQGNELVSSGPVDDAGAFALTLEAGNYELEGFARGMQPTGRQAVVIAAGATETQDLTMAQPGSVTVTVNDSNGTPLAARVSFVRQGATEDPAPPSPARFHPTWGGGITNVAYANRGPATILLPPGDYRAVASRGLSYELDEQTVTVSAGSSASLTFSLQRAVDTTGWLASDLHIHAEHSPDSSVPYTVRALQAATDDLDLPLITEHLATGALDGARAQVGVEDLVLDVPATEITSLAWGHFIAFPTLYDPTGVNRGALYPLDKSPPDIFAAERAAAGGQETIITVAHPRVSFEAFAYFDFVGLDSATMTAGDEAAWSPDFDTIEVFNGGCGTGDGNAAALADWIAMTNNGTHKTMISGSDTHAEDEPGGVPRTWIQVSAGDAAADTGLVVGALKQRRAFVSCGPFVTFASTDGARMGELAGVDGSGVATFAVTVEAPTWIGVDTVQLLENGLVVDSVDVSAPADPVVRFDGTFSVTPTADAWYAVEVLGSGSLQPVNENGPPYALTNDIRVDADGDGTWTAPGNP